MRAILARAEEEDAVQADPAELLLSLDTASRQTTSAYVLHPARHFLEFSSRTVFQGDRIEILYLHQQAPADLAAATAAPNGMQRATHRLRSRCICPWHLMQRLVAGLERRGLIAEA